MLRKIFWPKRDEATGEWRKLYNDELSDLYYSANIVRVIKSRMKWASHVARMGETKCVYRIFVEKPERKRQRGRPRYRWEDNIKIFSKWDVGEWSGLIRLRTHTGGGDFQMR